MSWWGSGSWLQTTKGSWYTRLQVLWSTEGRVTPMPASGKEMLRRYLLAGWVVIGRRGSHVKVGKGTEREVIPMHRELKRGLERKLLKRIRVDEGQ